jgi:hypothetical protein
VNVVVGTGSYQSPCNVTCRKVIAQSSCPDRTGQTGLIIFWGLILKMEKLLDDGGDPDITDKGQKEAMEAE